MLTVVRDDLAPSGVLRAAINLGNPVLAQGSPDDPRGVTVDLAYELAERLGLAARFECFDAARKSYDAMASGDADLCFLAVDPDRAEQVAFTTPYVVIEGVYAVARESSILTAADVDRPGVRVGVKRGSAYDLHLSRTLRHATVVRGGDGVDVFADEQLEVAAGVREPMVEYLLANPHLRLVDGRFMLIRQAIGTTRARRPETVAYLQEFVEDVKASGFVAQSLKRSGQSPSLVAAPEDAVRPL